MSDPEKIPPSLRAKIADLPPMRQAEALLTLPDLGLPPANAMEAAAAAMAWRLFQQGRRAGILGNRPAYEARETFAHRVRSAIQRSAGFDEWAVQLAAGVGVEFSALALLDRIHWRQALVMLTPTDWRRFSRSPVMVENVITSAALLSELMFELRDPTTTAPEASP